MGSNGYGVRSGATVGSEGFRGAVRRDGSFTYAPTAGDGDRTYADIGAGECMPNSNATIDDDCYIGNDTVHYPATGKYLQLCKLEAGDVLFHYADLEYCSGGEPELFYINPEFGTYLIGCHHLTSSPTVEDGSVVVEGESELFPEVVPLSVPTNGYTTNSVCTDLAVEPIQRLTADPLIELDELGVQNIFALVYDDEEVESPMVDYPEGEQYRRFLLYNGADEDFVIDGGFVDQLYFWFQENQQVDLKSEEALVATFVYLVCGRHPVMCDLAVKHGGTLPELYDNDEFYAELDEVAHEQLADLSEWPHAHATMHLNEDNAAEFVRDAVQAYHDEIGPSILEHVEEDLYHIAHETDEDQFDWEMLQMMRKVNWYGRLCAFDWNECLIRVHGYDWQAPKRCKRMYIDTAAPKPGFKRVFGFDMDDATDEEVNAALDDMDDFLQNDLHMTTTESVFVIESCLCNYVKLPNEVYRHEPGAMEAFL